jgi:heme-degrading monooxygenase HmoA
MIVQLVRFRSALSDEDVRATFARRAASYRAVPGLRQKYYLSYPGGEHGAVYLWESPEDMAAFRRSELAGTMREAYQLEGDPRVETADVDLILHDGPGGAARP